MATSFLVRLYNAFMEARMRQAMRELTLHGYVRASHVIQPVAAAPRQEAKRPSYASPQAEVGLLPFVR